MTEEGVIPYTLLVFFALIGVMTVIGFAVKFWKNAMTHLKNFNGLITETRDFLNEHRQDLRAAGQLREMFAAAQESSSPNFGPQAPAAEGAAPRQQVGIPTPLWETFKTKPPEADAPVEEVDYSPTERELVDEDRADQLERMGLGRPDPEFKPKAVEVESD